MSFVWSTKDSKKKPQQLMKITWNFHTYPDKGYLTNKRNDLHSSQFVMLLWQWFAGKSKGKGVFLPRFDFFCSLCKCDKCVLLWVVCVSFFFWTTEKFFWNHIPHWLKEKCFRYYLHSIFCSQKKKKIKNILKQQQLLPWFPINEYAFISLSYLLLFFSLAFSFFRSQFIINIDFSVIKNPPLPRCRQLWIGSD